jgi:hypothetical protein
MDDSAEARREAQDHRAAGRLARDEHLLAAARAFFNAVRSAGAGLRPAATPHAVHVAAGLLVDRAHLDALRHGSS